MIWLSLGFSPSVAVMIELSLSTTVVATIAIVASYHSERYLDRLYYIARSVVAHRLLYYSQFRICDGVLFFFRPVTSHHLRREHWTLDISKYIFINSN
jgi:hypothetical protein